MPDEVTVASSPGFVSLGVAGAYCWAFGPWIAAQFNSLVDFKFTLKGVHASERVLPSIETRPGGPPPPDDDVPGWVNTRAFTDAVLRANQMISSVGPIPAGPTEKEATMNDPTSVRAPASASPSRGYEARTPTRAE